MVAEDIPVTADSKPPNPVIDQMLDIYGRMPLSRKIIMGCVVGLVIIGFAGMFFWANKTEFQTVFSGLSPEDASEIVEKLKEQQIPYRLEGKGSIVKVPAEQIYDVRLSLAAAGLPRGGTIGYELFDQSDFGTTEFVQKMNYQRAVQGELVRTIREFREVEDARVMIVMPKDSVFIEETKPPSASVLLKLRKDLSKEKVNAIVHLVSSSLEDMTPELVTVVDTKGKILFKGTSEEEALGESANSQLKFKIAFEQSLAKRIQSMLERIVGDGSAIVRVNAEMDFDQVNINEEIFDPDVQIVRSRQNLAETSDKTAGPGIISSVNPIVEEGDEPGANKSTEKKEKQDETVNYELNKTIRRVIKPVGGLKRLSVAVVLDGTYKNEADPNGNMIRKYLARTPAELSQFTKIVQNAMGYSEDRGDQVTVESFSFSYVGDAPPLPFDFKTFFSQYWRTIVNLILVLLLFLVVVIPLTKAMKEIKASVIESLPSPEEDIKELPEVEAVEALPDPSQMPTRERSTYYAEEDIEKTINILRGWLATEK